MSDVLRQLLNNNKGTTSNNLPSLVGSLKLSQINKSRPCTFREPTCDRTLDQSLRIDQSQGEFEFRSFRQRSTHTANINQILSRNAPSPIQRSLHSAAFIESSRRTNLLCTYFYDTQQQYLDIVRKKDADRMVQYFAWPVEYAQRVNNLSAFTQFILLVAQFCQESDNMSRAVFFYKDLLSIAELSRDYPLKCRVLLHLANCARSLRHHNHSIKLCEKALTYAWHVGLHDEEIQAYDMIGLSYFYLGNAKKANYYHDKWAKAEIELQNSYYKRTSKEFISMYERHLPQIIKDIGHVLQGYLHLPYVNLLSDEGLTFDNSKQIKYHNCTAIMVLDEITHSIEFTDFHLHHHEPPAGNGNMISKRANLPRKIIEIQQKYSSNREKYELDHKINQNPLYKLSLQRQVDYRRQKSYSLNEVYTSVRRKLAESHEPFEKSEQIYVKHHNKPKANLLGQFRGLLLKLLDQFQ